MSTPRQRDHGLNRVSRVTRWFAVGAAAATGLFAFLLARPVASATAHTSDSATSDEGTATGAVGPATTLPASAGSSSSGSSSAKRTSPTTQLQSPAAAPQRTSRRARANSGGS